jgi:hypothetical protein
MIRFELHTPDGDVRRINEHHLKQMFTAAGGDFETKAKYRMGIVDLYKQTIEERIMPLLPKGTKIYVVIMSRLNEEPEEVYG